METATKTDQEWFSDYTIGQDRQLTGRLGPFNHTNKPIHSHLLALHSVDRTKCEIDRMTPANAGLRIDIKVDHFYPHQGHAKVELWTGIEWREVARLLSGRDGFGLVEKHDQLNDVEKRLLHLAALVLGITPKKTSF